MATIRAHQDQIIATQTHHTTILHQIQQHLSMQTPLGHDRSAPSEPLVPDEESLPAEQPIPEEQIRAEPSHDPTTIWSFYVFVLLVFYVRLVNSIFCMFYKLGLEVLLEIIHCIFLFQVIYIYIFILFYYIPFSHYSFVFGTCGLRYSIPPIHSDFEPQEVPLPPFSFKSLFKHWGQCLAWLGGELRKEVLY